MTESPTQEGRSADHGRRSQGEEYPGRDVARPSLDQPATAGGAGAPGGPARDRHGAATRTIDAADPPDIAYVGSAASAFGPLPWGTNQPTPDGYENRRLVENLQPLDDSAPAGHDPQLAPTGRPHPSIEQLPGHGGAEERRPGTRWAMTDREARTTGRPDPPGILVPASHGSRPEA